MFVWRKRASAAWLAANEGALREIAGQRFAIISRPERKAAIAEIAGSSQRNLEKIRSRFGGTIEKLPRDWLKEFSRLQRSEPIKIGNRLTIYRSTTSKNRSRNKNRSLLIPAGAAFGTGEHPTTAMSLRLLERCTRGWGAQAGRLQSSAACRRRLLKKGSASSRTQQAGSPRSPDESSFAHDARIIATVSERANRIEIDFRLRSVIR